MLRTVVSIFVVRKGWQITMRLVCRLALGLILVVGATRMVCYFIYSACHLTVRFETFHLEAKMVLLADRARAGESLYPSWHDYPHVANFFAPLYFVLVGRLGRLTGADFLG